VQEGEELPEPVSERSWDLGEPIRVVVARLPAPQEGIERVPESSASPLLDATEQIAAAEKALREARFELAVEWAERGRRLLEREGPAREVPGQRAQLEVLAATAEIALGQEEAARESLERALRAQPELNLDSALYSPKLVRLFEEVRSGKGTQP
jgi:tetratricopeptide (TPR) repeat protein